MLLALLHVRAFLHTILHLRHGLCISRLLELANASLRLQVLISHSVFLHVSLRRLLALTARHRTIALLTNLSSFGIFLFRGHDRRS
jgi:hypothetical protein